MSEIRVNMSARVDNSRIRHETRNGRNVIIVPSATLPDDVVMNGIKYPASVIEEGYKTLERTPAPLGHPKVNGAFVNASDPESINGYWVGAWNENVQRRNGRVFLDKVIDVERAEQSEGGQRLLEAINKGEPIHTSTGLFLNVDAVNAEDHTKVATSMMADHDAFLLDEPGAATPGQGVGVFVNSQGEESEVVESVINEDDYMLDDIAWAIVERHEMKRKKGIVEAVKEKIVSALAGVLKSDDEADGLSVNNSDEATEMTTEELQAALDKHAETLQANFKQELASTVKPLQEKVDAMNSEREAAVAAEKSALVQTVVNANLLDEETAATLDVNALRKLGEKAKPGVAAAAIGGAPVQTNSQKDEFLLPEGE